MLGRWWSENGDVEGWLYMNTITIENVHRKYNRCNLRIKEKGDLSLSRETEVLLWIFIVLKLLIAIQAEAQDGTLKEV